MDYVDWCDRIAEGLVAYAEEHGRHLHLQSFATWFIDNRCTELPKPRWETVVLDSLETVRTVGYDDYSPMANLTFAQIAELRDHYSRWEKGVDIPLDADSERLLAAVNELSACSEAGCMTVGDVVLEAILTEADQGWGGAPIDSEYAIELLDGLERWGLVHVRKTMDQFNYKSSYFGVAHTTRQRVADDRIIDELRAAGEGDTLDYKRAYYLDQNAQRKEFARDVVALANAGGIAKRYLLLGVEDDGSFFVPADETAAAQHRKSLDEFTETRLQQIATQWTTHTPSIQVVGRGEHRDGPYVLVEVSRDPAHLPYRAFKDQADRTAPNANELGEVLIRKGTTKAVATLQEVQALDRQAALYRSSFPGR